MIRRTQLTLLFAIETLLFVVASLFHVRALFVDYEYGRAAIAEDVIRAALALGLVASLMQPASTPLVAHAVQGFALLGSLVGTFTIAVGVGPRTHADIVFHVSCCWC